MSAHPVDAHPMGDQTDRSHDQTSGFQHLEAVLPAVWKLIRLRWRIQWNSFRHARLAAKIGTIIGWLALLAGGGFIFWLSWMLLSFIRSPTLAEYVGDLSAFVNLVPVLILSAAFLGILLTSFGVLLQALYLSGDMDFLLAAPVPIRAVFIAKVLDAVLPNFGLIALFGLPVMYGLGIANGYNILYFPLVPLMMLSLSLAGAGVAGILVMLVVRIFPARRVVEVLGFFGAIFSLICSQSGNMMNFASREADVSPEQVSSALTMLERFNTLWLPLNWPGRGLVALGENNWLAGVGLTLLSFGLALSLFWVSLSTAERWYYVGWAGMQVIARKKQQAQRARRSSSATARASEATLTQPGDTARTRPSPFTWLIAQVPAPVRGLVWKDILVLRRDLRQLSQLITPLIFGVIYGLMFLRSGGESPGGRGDAPAWFTNSFSALFAYGNVFLSVFVGWMLQSRLASMGFSQEGKNYWILKSAPLPARQILAAKFLVAYLPPLGLSVLFLLAFSLLQHIAPLALAYSLWVIVFCLAGMAGIQLSFGAAGANFKWEDPRRMNSGNLGCLGMFLTFLFVPVNLAVFLAPLLVAILLNLPQMAAYLVGGVLGSGFSLLCVILPLRFAEGRVSRLGED